VPSFCCDRPVVEAASQGGAFASQGGAFARQLSGMSNSSAGDVSPVSPYPGRRRRSPIPILSEVPSFCCHRPVVESKGGAFARQLSGMSNSSAGDVSADDFWTAATPAPEKQIVLQKDKLKVAMVRIAGISLETQEHIKISRCKRRSRIHKSHSWHAGGFADFEKTSSSAPQQEAESDTKEEQDVTQRRKSTSLSLFPDTDIMPEVPMMRQKQGVVIFDWDDTLFPSWHLAEVIQPCLPADHKYAQLKHDSVFYDSMRAHGTLIRSLFEIVCSYAHVQIVTLGMRPWVEDSAEWFLPELNLPALLEEYDIQIYYAREHVSRADMRAAMITEGVDLYSVAKRNAMMKCMTNVCKKDRGMELRIANVIAVGDSPAEIDAIQELMWSIDTDTNFCKTIKLLPEPTLQVLTMQLEVLKSWFPLLISYEDDADIDFGREDDPRISPVVKSLLAAST
jgi:hypothetical protein